MHRAKVIREDFAFILWLTFRQPLPRTSVRETGLKAGDFPLFRLLVETLADRKYSDIRPLRPCELKKLSLVALFMTLIILNI